MGLLHWVSVEGVGADFGRRKRWCDDRRCRATWRWVCGISRRRELIDNAWDAEATAAHVTLPDILSDAPIIVTDNGSGMKEQELRTDYLNIASPRLTRKGERTPNLLRVVKGRPGNGKFAGLILAATMEVETRTRS